MGETYPMTLSQNGTICIPAAVQERQGLMKNDQVHVTFDTDSSGEEKATVTRHVMSGAKVTIPARDRYEHDLEIGQTLPVSFEATGQGWSGDSCYDDRGGPRAEPL